MADLDKIALRIAPKKIEAYKIGSHYAYHTKLKVSWFQKKPATQKYNLF